MHESMMHVVMLTPNFKSKKEYKEDDILKVVSQSCLKVPERYGIIDVFLILEHNKSLNFTNAEEKRRIQLETTRENHATKNSRNREDTYLTKIICDEP